MTTGVTFDEVQNAYGVWRQLSNSPRNQNTVRGFFKFLGAEEDSDVFGKAYGGSELDTEVVNKIRWLNGPNAKALYEAWKARNPDYV